MKRKNVSIVAWGSWKEWDCVRAALFSSSPSRISAAIHRITAWQARTRVHIAVEITANILSIHQRDPSITEDISDESILSDEQLRLMYAMSIMRLINGVVDNKRSFKNGSIAARALKAALPHLLIDIRHDSAHGELPAISLLRMASKQALDWLKVFYWEQQKASLDSARKKLKSILMEYASLLEQTYISSEDLNNYEAKQLKKIKHDRLDTFHKLVKASLSACQDVVSILIDDMLLEKQPEDETNSEKHARDLAWKYVIAKLTQEMPQLLQMLVLGIVRRLTGLEAVADGAGYSFMHEGRACSSKQVESCTGTAALRMLNWLMWLLNSCEEEHKHKRAALKKAERLAREMQLECENVKGHISHELRKEILSLCLKGKAETGVRMKLVQVAAQHVELNATKASRLAELSGQPRVSGEPTYPKMNPDEVPQGEEEQCTKLGESSPYQETSSTIPNEVKDSDQTLSHAQAQVYIDENTTQQAGSKQDVPELGYLETSLKEMHTTQQRVLHGTQRTETGKDEQAKRQRWTLATNWQPCAIGMLPSSCYVGGVRPSWLLDCSPDLCSETPERRKRIRKVDTVPVRKMVKFTEISHPVKEISPPVKEVTVHQQGDNVDPAEHDDYHDETVKSTNGCLLLGGRYEKLGPELLASIQRDIRIL